MGLIRCNQVKIVICKSSTGAFLLSLFMVSVFTGNLDLVPLKKAFQTQLVRISEVCLSSA